ncbi:MAG TPA: hypothetical protein VF877_05255 [Gaiellaceae bacterium]
MRNSRICTGGIHASGSSPAMQQPQLQIAVGVVGLRAPLAAAPGGGLSGIGETRNMAGTLDLLDHEPPARRPFEHKLALQTVEPLKPLA